MSVKELIGKRIKEARQAKGLSQEALSEKIGMSAKYLSSVERGKENPTLDTLIKLADALEVEASELSIISRKVAGGIEAAHFALDGQGPRRKAEIDGQGYDRHLSITAKITVPDYSRVNSFPHRQFLSDLLMNSAVRCAHPEPLPKQPGISTLWAAEPPISGDEPISVMTAILSLIPSIRCTMLCCT